jgi:hypothetical protein
MYLVAAFQQSLDLEMAISDLLHSGINKENLLTIPLQDKKAQSSFDHSGETRNNSILDSAAISGTALMVLGTIYGFIWYWGPIIWGLIGLATGVALGALLGIYKNRSKLHMKKRPAVEVFLMLRCPESQLERSEEILWNRKALVVGRLNR